MSPHLHHGRVFAQWALRRPMSSGLGVILLLTGAAAVSVAQQRADGMVELLGGVEATLLFGVTMAMFGLMAGAMGGPTREGFRLVGHTQAMPALPLAPLPRAAAEVVGLLAVWLPAMLAVCALGMALPDTEHSLAGELHRMSGDVLGNLGLATFILLPSLLVGRRTSAVGTPSAFGPMLLAGLVTLPMGPLLSLAPLAIAPVSLGLALVGAWAAPRSEAAMERAIDLAQGATPPLRAAPRPWHTQRGAMMWRALLSMLPSMSAIALLFWVTEIVEVGGPLDPTQLFTTWLFPVLLLAAAPVFLPLGLDGRTAAPGGRSVPFDGSFAEAWRLLPVEPVTVRRAALQQAGMGGGLMVGASLALWLLGSRDGLEVGGPAVAALLLLGMATAAPLLAIMSLGTGRQRGLATGVATLLMGAVISHILGPVFFEGSAAAQALPTILVGVGAGISAWLVASMLRPAEDEVGGVGLAG